MRAIVTRFYVAYLLRVHYPRRNFREERSRDTETTLAINLGSLVCNIRRIGRASTQGTIRTNLQDSPRQTWPPLFIPDGSSEVHMPKLQTQDVIATNIAVSP